MVDTGATSSSMGAAEAERLGLDYKHGQRGMQQHRQRHGAGLRGRSSLRCASATSRSTTSTRSVCPAPMPYVLLGNSFLTRFQMKRENDLMTLDRRY